MNNYTNLTGREDLLESITTLEKELAAKTGKEMAVTAMQQINAMLNILFILQTSFLFVIFFIFSDFFIFPFLSSLQTSFYYKIFC